jgi:FKBP-type peptidyl-prolyl cis-trans isomerase
MINKRTYISLLLSAAGSFFLTFNALGAEDTKAQPSETELIEMLGYMTVFQAGMHDLGFTVEDADAIASGIRKGLQDAQPSAEMLSRMPAFQTFIQAKIAAAEAKMSERNAELAAGNAAEADAFFAKLKEDETVLSSESGLHYKVLEAGKKARASLEDTVLVHYKGTLIDGTQFDSSYDRGQAASFPLNGVVSGFGEGLTKIGEGGKVILYIPSDLGYGDNPRAGGPIGPGDTLIFECELIKINPSS